MVSRERVFGQRELNGNQPVCASLCTPSHTGFRFLSPVRPLTEGAEVGGGTKSSRTRQDGRSSKRVPEPDRPLDRICSLKSGHPALVLSGELGTSRLRLR